MKVAGRPLKSKSADGMAIRDFGSARVPAGRIQVPAGRRTPHAGFAWANMLPQKNWTPQSFGAKLIRYIPHARVIWKGSGRRRKSERTR